jgi:hypothetical protein
VLPLHDITIADTALWQPAVRCPAVAVTFALPSSTQHHHVMISVKSFHRFAGRLVISSPSIDPSLRHSKEAEWIPLTKQKEILRCSHIIRALFPPGQKR